MVTCINTFTCNQIPLVWVCLTDTAHYIDPMFSINYSKEVQMPELYVKKKSESPNKLC